MKKDLKNDKIQDFQQLSCCNVFQTMIDIDQIYFGGRNTSLVLTLNHLYMLTSPSDEPTLTFAHQLYWLAFLSTLLPVSGARSTIRQHMLTEFWESITQTIK